MPPRLTKPAGVPPERKNLVDLLWRFYVAAQRPTMRRIAETIEAWEDRRGSANHETVRRTLRGEAVGAWWTVEVIFLALCEIADVDPHDFEDDDYDGRFGSPPVSHLEQCHRYWNEAVDGAPMPAIPRTRRERDEQEAAAKAEVENRAAAWRSSNFDDEPPF
jgi:hypothetical protein